MRWKLIYLLLATATMSCSQVLTVDNNVNLDKIVTVPLPNFEPATPRDSVGEYSNDENNESQIPEKISEELIDFPASNESSSEPNDTDTVDISSESKENVTVSGAEDLDNIDNESGNGNENSVELPPNTEEVTKEEDDEPDVEQEIPPNSIENQPHVNETKPDSNEKEPSSNEGGEQSAENGETEDQEDVQKSKSSEQTEEIIETKYGPVRGSYLHESTGILSYIDIPYGAFKELFQAPIEPTTWEDVHEIIEHNKRCPQLEDGKTYVGDIDCLTLSVFTPSEVENAPVLFHIHDGHFTTGSGDPSIYGPEHLVTKGIILVLPNYRLGPLGFLCLQNDIAPGNAALKDLTLALDWTKNNIAAFGGDPEKIVVSGDGSSGALAGYLAISPSSRDYISGVITESGALIAPFAIDRDPVTTAHQLEEIMEADIAPNTDIELLIKSAKDIVFKPCIEHGPESFMNETAWQMLQNKIDINFMIGSANHAGMHEALENLADLKEQNKEFSEFLPKDLEFKNDRQKNDVVEEIRKQYFEDEDISLANAHQFSLFYTDSLYLGPAIRTARHLIEAGATVHFYEFSYVGELNRELNSLLRTVNGTARGDIVGYVFTQDGEMPKTESDEAMVDLMTELWVTFIQSGKPSVNEVEWSKLTEVDESEEQWLSIGSKVQQEAGIHVDRLHLWTLIYKNHFVDHNLAFAPTSSICLLVFALIYKVLIY